MVDFKQAFFPFIDDDGKGEDQARSTGLDEQGWFPQNRTSSAQGGLFSPSSPLSHVTTLEELNRLAQGCTACGLHQGRRTVVFGDGNPQARLMFVGEGPGASEDEQGLPFVGAAGQLLNRILDAAGIRRDQVFITNVVMCRPPGNRLPLPGEVEACNPFLKRKIELIKPRIIVTLGALATQVLIDPKARITQVRGKWFEKDGISYLPTFHPAALLRDTSKKRPVWEDFQVLSRRYSGL